MQLKFFFNLKNIRIISDKIIKRFNTKNYKTFSITENNVTDMDQFMLEIDSKLHVEAKDYYIKLKTNSHKTLSSIPYRLGGGGAYNLIYFLIRLYQPEVVVESGVAAGFSSNSILTAIKKNKKGFLFSSDFPYFRIPDPEKYIGILVEESLKMNWKLFIEGDIFNLPKIRKEISKIDFIHYDSDKSYSGRSFFFSSLKDLITSKTVILIDDIQDNSFFYDYLHQHKSRKHKVFKFENKFVGLIY
ncbi:class I SAM-dependent methyltransferase [Alphaproteobacteria bacterium]|nr:class I SAM-dependent methyltransferase [Alphaproteobacteria bacterium]